MRACLARHNAKAFDRDEMKKDRRYVDIGQPASAN